MDVKLVDDTYSKTEEAARVGDTVTLDCQSTPIFQRMNYHFGFSYLPMNILKQTGTCNKHKKNQQDSNITLSSHNSLLLESIDCLLIW